MPGINSILKADKGKKFLFDGKVRYLGKDPKTVLEHFPPGHLPPPRASPPGHLPLTISQGLYPGHYPTDPQYHTIRSIFGRGDLCRGEMSLSPIKHI